MNVKKNPKADIEKYRTLFFQFGLVLTLGVVLLAFEWPTRAGKVTELVASNNLDIEEEIIPVTRQEQNTPPPPPPAPQVSEVLNIVDDNVEIEEEYEIEDAEADQNTQVDFVAKVEEEEQEAEIFFIVEKMPEFPGGELGLRKWIAEHVKYPNIARENNIQGKVYVRFAVTESGSVDKVSIARGVDPLLDEEAIRVVKMSPKWSPGEQRGKKVSVWYTVPINFQLQ